MVTGLKLIDGCSTVAAVNSAAANDGITTETLSALSQVIAPLGELTRCELLSGGMFATTYRVTLADGTRVVAKTAPTDTRRLLTHEHDLLRSEAEVYALAAGDPDLLMPRLLLTDFTRELLPTDVVVAAHLDGTPVLDLPDGELTEVDGTPVPRGEWPEWLDHQLGALMARLHRISNDEFGYLNRDSGLRAASWADAFTLMVEAMLADAALWGVDVPAEAVRRAIADHRGALDLVTTPSLVHADLWQGNLFVDAAAHRLVGVIDPERALWADPLFDLIGNDQLGTGTVRPTLIAGHAAGGEHVLLGTPDGRVRHALYRLYMGLIQVTECVPRQFSGDWLAPHLATAYHVISQALQELDAAR